MDKDRGQAHWRRVKQLFAEVVDLEPQAREERLRAARAKEPDVCAEVDSMLEAESRAPLFLDHGAAAFAKSILGEEAKPAETWEGRRFGSYRVTAPIAAGGMGEVFLATRDDGTFEHQVAIKVMRPSHGDQRAVRQRFHVERQILASLQHPSIARILDGGVTDEGLPYLVMEYVEGEELLGYARERRLGLDERLDLFQQICSAVGHAHRHLVVHRDLKPSNILVTADGRVKLLDFGIAKLLDAERFGGESGLALTRTGLMPLTPEYAAPEQVRGAEITTATDVYALGLLLCELLADARPYDLRGKGPTEIERTICELEPERPSELAGRLATAGGTSAIDPTRLRGDLDTIVLTALRKEPADRYESARALSDELERFRKALPIQARPPTWTYRTRKFVSRNRYAVAGLTLFLLAMTGALGAVVVQRNRAETEALKAQQVTEFLVELFRSNEPSESLGEELTAREVLERGQEGIGRLADEPDVQARLLSVLGRVYSKLGVFDQAEPLLRQAIETAEDSQERARSLSELGDLLYERGELEDAELFHREALAVRRRARPHRQREIASGLHALGKTLLERESPEAEAVLSEALAMRERLLGPLHPETAESLNELGRHFHSANRCDEAIPMFRRSIEIFEAVDDGSDLRAADPMSNLSVCFTTQGKLREAEALNRDVLGRYVTVFGEDHPNVMTQRNNLAVVLAMQGYFGEAEEIMRQLLVSRRRSMPAGAYTGNTLGNLGAIVLARERYVEAEPILRETITLMREKFGPDHPRLARRINSLGSLKIATGELDAAEHLFQESLSIFERTQRTDHPEYLVAQRGMGRILGERGRTAEAVARLRETLAAERRVRGEDHAAVADTLEALGLIWLRSVEVDRAMNALRESLEIRITSRGEAHPDTARSRRLLAEALVAAGDLSAAEPMLLEAHDVQVEKLRAEHPQIASTRAALVDLYTRQGRSEAAARYR